MKGRSIEDLNRDYLEAVARAVALGLEDRVRDRLAAYQRFFGRNGYRLEDCPGVLREVMLAEAADSPVRADVMAEEEAGTWRPCGPRFQRLYMPAHDPNPGLRATIVVGSVHSVVWPLRSARC